MNERLCGLAMEGHVMAQQNFYLLIKMNREGYIGTHREGKHSNLVGIQ